MASKNRLEFGRDMINGKMNNVLVSLYRIPNRLVRRIIEKVILKRENGYAFSKTIRLLYAKYYNLHIGYGSYGGCFNHTNIPRPSEVHFGNYCSIGSGLKIFRANHPSDKFTTHPFLYNPAFKYVEKDQLIRPALHIGNDVWTGSGVTICPGCKSIGDGAIIGAGSIVTHDVPAYTIMVGCPAKPIRKRFNDRQIVFLQNSKWWELDLNTLKDKVSYFEESLRKLE